MSSAGAHTDERCRQPAFLPGPPPPQEVESSSGSAKVSAAPRCPSAGTARWDSPGRAEPRRAVPGSAEPSRAAPAPLPAVPTRVTRGTPSSGPAAAGGAAPLPWGARVSPGARPLPGCCRRGCTAGDVPAGCYRRGCYRRGCAGGSRVGSGEGRPRPCGGRAGAMRGHAALRGPRLPAELPPRRAAAGAPRRAGRAPAVLRLPRPARLLNSPLQNTAVCLVSGGIKILRGKTRK